MNMKEMNPNELEQVNGGEGNVQRPRPVDFPMPRPNDIVKPFPDK